MDSSSVLQRICLFLLLVVVVSVTEVRGQSQNFDVTKYGAVADGTTDNSKAFSSAWNDACQWKGTSSIVIPAGTYMLNPILFRGECNGAIEFQIEGNLKASTDPANFLDIDHWMTFQYVNNLKITGGGSLDGQGASAWPYNDCQKDSGCKKLPTTLRFDYVNNSIVEQITSINSKNVHINIFGCQKFIVSNINISAPSDSPNTDGIHIGDSSDIQISDSTIGTGDDCISLSPGSERINVSHVHCGPGHGISVGSLGGSPNEEPITELTVSNSNFSGTLNGLRIKTWAPSSPGLVSNITFQDIKVDNVDNPIYIDQHYCPSKTCDDKGASSVQIHNVSFKNISGTSNSKNAVNIQCSSSVPCKNIEFRDINLSYNGPDGPAASLCSFVNGASYGIENPKACI